MALFDGLDAALGARSPEVPTEFSSTANTRVSVEGGLAKHSGLSGSASLAFTGGGIHVTQPTRVFRAGVRFDATAVVGGIASVQFYISEEWELVNPKAKAGTYVMFHTDGSVTVLSNTLAEVLGYDFGTDEVTLLAESTPGDVYTSADVWSAGPDVTHELRLEVSAAGFRGYIGGVTLFNEPWSSGTLSRALTPSYVSVVYSRGVSIDYIQLDLDE